MAAYREVTLTLPEVRAGDFLKFKSCTYKLEAWHTTAEIGKDLDGSLYFKPSAICYAQLQRIDLDGGTSMERIGNPTYITIGRSDALRVLVPVGD